MPTSFILQGWLKNTITLTVWPIWYLVPNQVVLLRYVPNLNDIKYCSSLMKDQYLMFSFIFIMFYIIPSPEFWQIECADKPLHTSTLW